MCVFWALPQGSADLGRVSAAASHTASLITHPRAHTPLNQIPIHPRHKEKHSLAFPSLHAGNTCALLYQTRIN